MTNVGVSRDVNSAHVVGDARRLRYPKTDTPHVMEGVNAGDRVGR